MLFSGSFSPQPFWYNPSGWEWVLSEPGYGFHGLRCIRDYGSSVLILLVQSLLGRKGTEESASSFCGTLVGKGCWICYSRFCIHPCSSLSGLSGSDFPAHGMPSFDRGKAEMVAADFFSWPEQPCELLCLRKALSLSVPGGYSEFLRGESWVFSIIS